LGVDDQLHVLAQQHRERRPQPLRWRVEADRELGRDAPLGQRHAGGEHVLVGLTLDPVRPIVVAGGVGVGLRHELLDVHPHAGRCVAGPDPTRAGLGDPGPIGLGVGQQGSPRRLLRQRIMAGHTVGIGEQVGDVTLPQLGEAVAVGAAVRGRDELAQRVGVVLQRRAGHGTKSGAAAVSGRAGAVSSWLNLVERLVCGADDQLAVAWYPAQRPGAGGSIRGWVELCGGGPGPRQP
jgi:hypothetical protein